MSTAAALATPPPIPDLIRETTFTAELGACFSATRGGADQRQLRALVTGALLKATDDPQTLNLRWLQDDSWHWTPHGTLAPDLIATDSNDVLALIQEAKSLSANMNASAAKGVRRAIERTDERLARIGATRDPRSVKISGQAVPTDPRWDQPHTFADCQHAGDECLWHTGANTAGVHQGDVYASQFAYLSEDIKIPDDGLESVDFIALLPTVRQASKWGHRLFSYERWHVASVGEMLNILETERGSLPDDQRAWLDRLLAIARRIYGPSRELLATRSELAEAYRASHSV